jgi:uncharacterized flavoprotein (TIGR03862 family)
MRVVIVGAGPAGLMAAEVLSQAGQTVEVFDDMPSVGRKFLLAGIGGLNLTHGEAAPRFMTRYAQRQAELGPAMADFDAQALQAWAHGLGIETFVGSSGRVFPKDMKAAPLLRAWLHRLRHPDQGPGVVFHMRHRWQGWNAQGELVFDTPQGQVLKRARATVLALGGGSWARLGSDGAWVPWLQAQGVDVAPLQPSNCGFDMAGGWSSHLRERQAGQAFKHVSLHFTDARGRQFDRKGEFVLTEHGVEGSLIYAASALIRDEIAAQGSATVHLDLLPDVAASTVMAAVAHPRGARSWSSHLKSRLDLGGVKAALLQEVAHQQGLKPPGQNAQHAQEAQVWGQLIKRLPLTLTAARPLDEAISSAGGVGFEAMTPEFMLRALPGVFCAGEMLDWEAPTGGYLLNACMATGRWAGLGALKRVLG